MDKEKLIKQIMAECAKDGEPVTYEEAAEMAEMEMKAKTDCKRYEREEKQNKPTNRIPKIDAEKVEIIKSVAQQLTRFVKPDAKDIEGAENIKITNQQKEITFTVGENEYSLTLTKHRKKKEGKQKMRKLIKKIIFCKKMGMPLKAAFDNGFIKMS